ncbi:hypothetical protein BDN72DRAFT_959638 [Pluteus cervinus]|uniref:Uncharacterized protein n=1 Tax=Pluteus cervinus TaxID=181527 RepID=A0ACD3AUD6_9AGAR|nr:hypothetical protein BDN72DRAFT_959638 [Pluteus cervinus]
MQNTLSSWCNDHNVTIDKFTGEWPDETHAITSQLPSSSPLFDTTTFHLTESELSVLAQQLAQGRRHESESDPSRPLDLEEEVVGRVQTALQIVGLLRDLSSNGPASQSDESFILRVSFTLFGTILGAIDGTVVFDGLEIAVPRAAVDPFESKPHSVRAPLLVAHSSQMPQGKSGNRNSTSYPAFQNQAFLDINLFDAYQFKFDSRPAPRESPTSNEADGRSELDGHIELGDFLALNLHILPIAVASTLLDIIPLLSSILSHRRLWNLIDGPVMGLALQPGSTIARLVVAWTSRSPEPERPELDDDNQLPQVHITFPADPADPDGTIFNPTHGVFDLANPSSMLALFHFILKLSDQFNGVRPESTGDDAEGVLPDQDGEDDGGEGVQSYVDDEDDGSDDRNDRNDGDDDGDSEYSEYIEDSDNSDDYDDEDDSQTEDIPLEHTQPQELSWTELSSVIYSYRNLGVQSNTGNWLISRNAFPILCEKTIDFQDNGFTIQKNDMVDKYISISRPYLPEEWLSSSGPSVGVHTSDALALWLQKQHEEQLTWSCVERIQFVQLASKLAQQRQETSNNHLHHDLMEPHNPIDWEVLIHSSLRPTTELAQGWTPAVWYKSVLNLTRDHHIDTLPSTTSLPFIVNRTELRDFHKSTFKFVKTVLAETEVWPEEELSCGKRQPTWDFMCRISNSITNAMKGRQLGEVLSTIQLIRRYQQDPTQGTSHMAAGVVLPNDIFHSILSEKNQSEELTRFLGSFLFARDVSNDSASAFFQPCAQPSDSCCNIGCEARKPSCELDFPSFFLPVLLVESQSPDPKRGGYSANNSKIFSIAAVSFLVAIGIEDQPVYHLTVDGPYGVLGMTSYCPLKKCILYTADNLMAYNLCEPMGAYLASTMLLKIREEFEILVKKFEVVKDSFLQRLSDPTSRADLNWSQKAQKEVLPDLTERVQMLISSLDINDMDPFRQWLRSRAEGEDE